MPQLRRRPLAALPLVVALAASTAFAAPPAASVVHPELWPKLRDAGLVDADVEAKVTALMARLSVEEKVGQTIQGDIGSIKPEDLRKYPLGSVLAGGNSGPDNNDRAPAQAWLDLAQRFYEVSTEKRPGHTPIPVLFGVDAVHGHNNIIGATLFPHNIGLGAARDPDLIRRIGEATASELNATGVDWTFAPTVAVVRDDRWGRSYESYSEEPEIVAQYAGAVVRGLQGEGGGDKGLAPGKTISSAKHYLGDGGTDGGKDQGDNKSSERELVRVANAGYPPAIEAGVLTVMASFSSWQGDKVTGHKGLLTDALKGRMGFQGFVVSDWNAHSQVAGCTLTSCPQALNAGIDMYMAPDSWKGLYTNTLAQVKSGQIPMARLDDAVRRILRVKFKAGLMTSGPPKSRPGVGQLAVLGSADHRAVAREAVRKSLVLLKNEGGLLPLSPKAHVLVAGGGADNIGQQAGGWTISWQGNDNKNSDFPGGHSIWGGIQEAVTAAGGAAELAADGAFGTKPDVAIVVFGETPYAEFQGDRPNLDYTPTADVELLRKLKAQGIPTVAVFLSGRPLFVNPELNASDAFVAAWLPGSEGEGVADVLFRKADGSMRYDFTGKLSFSWPKRADQYRLNKSEGGAYDPLFAYGYGLTYRDRTSVPQLSEVSGVAEGGGSSDVFFASGRVVAPWELATTGAVISKVIDAGAQENARVVSWSGEGAFVVRGPAVDLQRQATGDMAVNLRLRVDQAPTAPVRLGLGKSSVDVSRLLPMPGEVATLKVKLSCLRAAGADLAAVTEPVVLSTSGAAAVTILDLRITSNTGDAVCPA
jgi:beta-glucosidase